MQFRVILSSMSLTPNKALRIVLVSSVYLFLNQAHKITGSDNSSIGLQDNFIIYMSQNFLAATYIKKKYYSNT
jgi:hypothetical protein